MADAEKHSRTIWQIEGGRGRLRYGLRIALIFYLLSFWHFSDCGFAFFWQFFWQFS